MLYRRHLDAGIDPYGNYEGFKAGLIDFLQEPCVFLFRILPRFKVFSENFAAAIMSDEECFRLMAGLINLLGVKQGEGPMSIGSDIIPDIKIVSDKDGCVDISTFENGAVDTLSFLDDIFIDFFENASVEDYQSLSEEEQLLCLKLLDIVDLDFSHENYVLPHKKLVFGLHIPEALKDYHQACARELCLRILTSPVYAHMLETFLNRSSNDNIGGLYFQDGKDKRFMVSALMREFAQIWQIPEPIEEKLCLEPEKDKEDKEFNTFMQASYVSFLHKDRQAGLIFQINAHGGYLPPKNQNMYTFKSLAHEFGHLISDFMAVHLSHKPWRADAETAKLIRKTPLAHMQEEQLMLSFNNQYTLSGVYYSPVKTDFTGFPQPLNDHYYKGQLEERHADYVGELVQDYIGFGLECRKAVRNLDIAQDMFEMRYNQFLEEIMHYTCDEQDRVRLKDKERYINAIYDATSFHDLEVAAKKILDDTQRWCELAPDEWNDLHKFTKEFFIMREMVLEQDASQTPIQEISLC